MLGAPMCPASPHLCAQAALGDLLRRGSGPVAQQQQQGQQMQKVKEEREEEEDLTEEPEEEGEQQRTGARTPPPSPLSPQPTGSTGRRMLPSAVHGGAGLYDAQYEMPYDVGYDISPGT